MITFEKTLSSYDAYFSYEEKLNLYDPILHNMVSERYRCADYEEEDLDSDSDLDEDEETEEVISDSLPRQEFSLSDVIEYATKEKNNQYEFMFCSFNSDFVPTKPIKTIQPKIEGSAIKIGEIRCFFNNEKQICVGKTLFDLADSELVPDLKCCAFSESVPSVFDHHRVDIGLSFAKIHAPLEIKKSDRSTGSKFCNDLHGIGVAVFDPRENFTVTVILPPLSIATPPPSSTISPTLDLISTKHSRGSSLVFDLGGFPTHIAFAAVSTVSAKHRSVFGFDPGGTTAVAVASHDWFLVHHDVWIVVFDPGGNCRQRSTSTSHSLFRTFQKGLALCLAPSRGLRNNGFWAVDY